MLLIGDSSSIPQRASPSSARHRSPAVSPPGGAAASANGSAGRSADRGLHAHHASQPRTASRAAIVRPLAAAGGACRRVTFGASDPGGSLVSRARVPARDWFSGFHRAHAPPTAGASPAETPATNRAYHAAAHGPPSGLGKRASGRAVAATTASSIAPAAARRRRRSTKNGRTSSGVALQAAASPAATPARPPRRRVHQTAEAVSRASKTKSCDWYCSGERTNRAASAAVTPPHAHSRRRPAAVRFPPSAGATHRQTATSTPPSSARFSARHAHRRPKSDSGTSGTVTATHAGG